MNDDSLNIDRLVAKDNDQTELWKKIAAWLGLPIAVAAGAVWIGNAAGCEAARDFTAKLIGAPTSVEIAAVEAKQDEAEQRIEDADQVIAQLTRAVDQTQRTAEQAQARKDMIRGTYAEAAMKLNTLSGDAADAMIDVMDRLQKEMMSAKSDAERIGVVVADYEGRLVSFGAMRDEAARDFDDSVVELEGLDEQARNALKKMTDMVGFFGNTASDLGVPGAKAATGMLQTILSGAVASVLGIGTISGVLGTRKQRRRADGHERERRRWEHVILTNEKLDLIEANDAKKEVARRTGRRNDHEAERVDGAYPSCDGVIL